MKESKLIIIIFIFTMIILIPIFYISAMLYPNFDYFSIGTNLYCGLIVGLITGFCQYCAAKRRIVNNVYSAYFDVYRTYYYVKNNSFFFHYNSNAVYKKIAELGIKLNESLDEYNGLLRKYDSTYKKLNPNINLDNKLKVKNIRKSTMYLFNKKSFIKSYDGYIKDIESILININKKRFEKDYIEMVKMYNYLYGDVYEN